VARYAPIPSAAGAGIALAALGIGAYLATREQNDETA